MRESIVCRALPWKRRLVLSGEPSGEAADRTEAIGRVVALLRAPRSLDLCGAISRRANRSETSERPIILRSLRSHRTPTMGQKTDVITTLGPSGRQSEAPERPLNALFAEGNGCALAFRWLVASVA